VVLRKLGEGGEIAKEKAGNGSGGRMDGWFGEKKKGGDHFIQRLGSKM